MWVPTVKNNQTYQYNTVQCTIKKIIPIRDVGWVMRDEGGVMKGWVMMGERLGVSDEEWVMRGTISDEG